MVLLLQLNIKQELKLCEPGIQGKKDKKAVKDPMACPKKKKRKQRSPAKVEVKDAKKTILDCFTAKFVQV